jgi:hypothetical protein
MKRNFLLIMGVVFIAFLMTGCPKKANECVPCEDPDCPGCPPTTECTAVTPPTNDDYVANFPDGQFEVGFTEKEGENGLKFDDYSNELLRTINDLYGLPTALGGPGPITTKKICSDIDSRYALKITSYWMKLGESNILIPGAIGTLSSNFISEFIEHDGAIGTKKPFTQKPASFKGYMKYEPVAGDSAAIEITIYNGDNVIGSGKLIKKSAVSSYTLFEVPIIYTDASPATHISLIMSSSAGYNFSDLLNCKGQEASTLYIDRVWWKF